MRISLIFVLQFVCFAVFCQNSPNIVLIMADDQGWNGTSVQMDPDNEGSNSDFYETPNIERIAALGMRFSQAYAPAPKCSPTRMSILTGQTPARNQFTNTTSMVAADEVLVEPSSRTQITSDHTTIAELLQTAETPYLSAHFGKWHIGDGGPSSHGFDDGDGATSNGDGETGVTVNDDPKKIFEITEKGIDFMESALAGNKPFYLQLSHYAVHTSVEYTQSSFDKYDAITPGGVHSNVGFAAMTEDLDVGVGRILDFLEQNDLASNTYVIYCSDNGAQSNQSPNTPLNGSKTLLFEGGIRVPLIIMGPGIMMNSHSEVPVVGYDFFPTFAGMAGISLDDLTMNLDGHSLLELLKGDVSSLDRSIPITFHSPHYETSNRKQPRSAIVVGQDKLMVEYETGDRLQYDLFSDLSESENNYSSVSDLSAKLLIQLRDYLKSVEAQMPLLSSSNSDADDDGLPDEWEFKNLLGAGFDGEDDPDGDGVSNMGEYSEGTDPLGADVITTGVASLNMAVTLYPNPFVEKLILTIDNPSGEAYLFEMYSLLGERVFSDYLKSSYNVIPLESLPPGLYSYRLSGKGIAITGTAIGQ